MLYTILMCISHFIFFLPVTYYLMFTFSLDYRNDVRQKANSSNFLFKFRIGRKAAETTWNINKFPETENFQQHPETVNTQSSGGLRNFATETRALKMKSTVTGHQKLTKTNLDHWSWSSYNFTRSCWRTQYWPFCDHSAWSKSEKVKKLDKWRALEPTKIFFKKLSFCTVIFSLYTRVNNFSIGLWCPTKSGLYTTASNDQLSGWTEKKFQIIFQSQTRTQKCYDHSWMFCCQFDPLPLSEFQRNHSIWEVCSADRWHALKAATPAVHCSTERTQFFFMTTPDPMAHNAYFQSWTNVASFAIFMWPLDNQLPLLQVSW